jgi:DNA-directed RNA polymerase specialized sigma subunit
MLNADQQKLVEEAIKLVPVCINVFMQTMPCLRSVAASCDLESAAYMACCKAAKTYDPSRSKNLSAYFSVAIKNGMLREVQNELKTQAHSVLRLSLSQAQQRQKPKSQPPDAAISSLMRLTEQEREWIERFVFEETSFNALGRDAGCAPKTAKRKLMSHLDRLRQAYEDEPLA